MGYKIYCDMDGVIADFDFQFKQISNNISPRNYEKKFGMDMFWEMIDGAGIKFWSEIPWMDDGKQLWSYIKKYNPQILSAPSRNFNSELGKKEWMKKHLQSTPLILAFRSEKQDYSQEHSILIDDRLDTINEWKMNGGVGIHHTSALDTIKQLKQIGL